MAINLEEIVKKYRILTDTSSLMTKKSEKFFLIELLPILEKNKKCIVVPLKVKDEIEKHLNNNDEESEKYKDAKRAIDILKSYNERGIIEMYADNKEPFVDALILSVLNRFITMYNIVIITQDRDLASDINNIKNQTSIQHKRHLMLFRINNSGNIKKWYFQDVKGTKESAKKSKTDKKSTKNEDKRTKVQKNNKLSKAKNIQTRVTKPSKNIRDDKDSIIPVKMIPSTGDKVISPKFGKLNIGNEIDSGGEGTIYDIKKGFVCKIYQNDKITKYRKDKIQKMLDISFDSKGICWPNDILTNEFNEFIGILMPKVSGDTLWKLIFSKRYMEKTFSRWKREHLVKICISILHMLEQIHEKGILMGDINPNNILVQDENRIYLIDMDSSQVDNIPCPVGMPLYTSPELYDRCDGRYDSCLRKITDENFAIAVLLFMILLPGKSPYSYQGGGSIRENMKNRQFPYPLGEKSTGNAPMGPWRFIWSNLPYQIKRMFYSVFAEGKRYRIDSWIRAMEKYQEGIQNKKYTNDIFPSRFKIVDPIDIRCDICGDKYQENKSFVESLREGKKKVICPKCKDDRSRGIKVKCDKCGREKTIAYIHKKKKKKYLCKSCVDEIKSNIITKRCSICGVNHKTNKDFIRELESDGKEFMCESCRDKFKDMLNYGKCTICGSSLYGNIVIEVLKGYRQQICGKCQK